MINAKYTLKLPLISFTILLLGVFSTCSAQLFVDVVDQTPAESFDFYPALSFSEIEYEDDADIERSILSLGAAYGLSNELAIFGDVGVIFDSELPSGDDGDGFSLGAGVKGQIARDRGFSFHYLGQLRLIDEDYDNAGDGDFLELTVGGFMSFVVPSHERLSLFGGLELTPYSDGEVGSADVDRDDILGVRFGAGYEMDVILLRAEVAAISETAVILRAGLRL